MSHSVLIDWIAKWSEYTPDKTCIQEVESGKSISYSDLNRKAINSCKYLTESFGIKKGDRIAILAEFSIAYVTLFSVAQKLGVILVPLNYRLSKEELKYQILDSGSSLILFDDIFEAKIDFETPQIGSLRLAELAESINSSEIQDQIESYSGVSEDDPLFILYTSGTTGKPKGCIYTHKMAFWNSINTQLRLDLNSTDHTLICMPPFHTGGWNVLLTPLLHHGATVSLVKKFDPDVVLKYLDEEACTIFMAVPTMLKMMAASSSFDNVDLDAMRYFIVGGESMLISQIEHWQKKGIPIRQGYGLTEVGPNITSLNQEDAIRKKGSIGKPNFYVETRLVNKNGKDSEVNEEGELWLKGPMTTPGYWNNPAETEKSFDDGWFKTGDVLVKDEEGFLYVKDRIKNMFISGGENVYPAEVEEVLSRYSLIDEVAVIGIPDSKWGEVGKAIIIAKAECNEEGILEYCKDKLARFKIPKKFLFVEEIPKTDSGKIDRKSLKARFGNN